MGEAKRKLSSTWGERAHLVDGTMRIVRFKKGGGHGPVSHQVEFYTDGLTRREGYDAICEIKKLFEQADGFSTPVPAPLWCAHVRGPDDLVPAPDYASAVAMCDAIAEIDRKHAGDENMPRVSAVPLIWSGTREQHSKYLAERYLPGADYPIALGAPPAPDYKSIFADDVAVVEGPSS